jgi:hypothetical protein
MTSRHSSKDCGRSRTPASWDFRIWKTETSSSSAISLTLVLNEHPQRVGGIWLAHTELKNRGQGAHSELCTIIAYVLTNTILQGHSLIYSAWRNRLFCQDLFHFYEINDLSFYLAIQDWSCAKRSETQTTQRHYFLTRFSCIRPSDWVSMLLTVTCHHTSCPRLLGRFLTCVRMFVTFPS